MVESPNINSPLQANNNNSFNVSDQEGVIKLQQNGQNGQLGVKPNVGNNNDNNNVNGPGGQQLNSALHPESIKNMIKGCFKHASKYNFAKDKTDRIDQLSQQLAGGKSKSASHAEQHAVSEQEAKAIETNLEKLIDKKTQDEMKELLKVPAGKFKVGYGDIKSSHNIGFKHKDKEKRQATAAGIRQMVREAVLNTFAKTGKVEDAESVKYEMLRLLHQGNTMDKIHGDKTDTAVQKFARELSNATTQDIHQKLEDFGITVQSERQDYQADPGQNVNNNNNVNNGQQAQVNVNPVTDNGQGQQQEGVAVTFDGKLPDSVKADLSEQELTDLLISKNLQEHQVDIFKVTAGQQNGEGIVENNNIDNVDNMDDIVETNNGDNDGEFDPFVENAKLQEEQVEGDRITAQHLRENQKDIKHATQKGQDGQDIINNEIEVTKGDTPDDDNKSIIDGDETTNPDLLDEQDVIHIKVENPEPPLETNGDKEIMIEDDGQKDLDQQPKAARPATKGDDKVTQGKDSDNPSPASKKTVGGKIIMNL